jgi:hypothetical protein
VAILVSIGSPGAVSAELAAAPPPEASPAAPPQDDYYTARARRILKDEKAAWVKPHPLAASFPGMDVVVCEAGCPEGRGAHVVSVRKHSPLKEAREAMMLPTSGSDEATTDSDRSSPTNVACVAGCYGKAYAPGPLLVRRPAPAQRFALPPRDKLSPIR